MSTCEIKPICLRLLARREHSQKELMTKLNAKGFENTEIQVIIDQLAAQNLQSDARFAENYARSRFYKGFGLRKVKYELQQRGIDNYDLQSVLRENFSGEYDLMTTVYHQKYRSSTQLLPKEQLKRQRFLQNRGFSFHLIQQLFRQLTLNTGIF
ncbi:MAG: regulatory protein RecX [Methylococcales bacterium]|nr:regulatory protein RecX [Methylococcales bacterium]